MYFDSHTHLNNIELYPNRSKYISDFYNHGGRGVVNIWIDLESSQKAIQIAKENSINDMKVLATIGLHPSYISENSRTLSDIDDYLLQLKDMYIQNKEYIYAIGEIGTDLHYETSKTDYQMQKYMFAKQCQLATDLWLPIIIHSRDDRAGTAEVLHKFQNLKIYMHCWWYASSELQYLLDHFDKNNIYIWFAGNLTYPKAKNIQESLKFAYKNKMNILTETDAPYLKPQIVRWIKEPNKSEYVIYIYDYIAENLWIDKNSLQELIKNNFYKFYSLS